MRPPTLVDFVRDKSVEIKAVLDPAKNTPNVERLAGVAVIGLRWLLEGMLSDLAKMPQKERPPYGYKP